MPLKLLLIISAPFISSVTFACTNWQATTQNNQPTGWDYQLNPEDITVVPDPLDAQSKVTKLTITPDSTWPNGQTRAEVKHNGCATDEGDNTYFSWQFYLDKPIQTTNNIAYWETDKTYQQSMGFSLHPTKKNGKKTNTVSFFSSLPSRKIHWQDTVTIQTWNTVALAIKWSESAQKGQVSVWFNGAEAITALALKTKPDANKLFAQLGLHRNQAEASIDSIYLRNVKEAANLELLLSR